MLYENYHFWGMHFVWWFVWVSFLFWIFALPYSVPGQRFRRESAIDILQKRFASGQINSEVYHERLKELQRELNKK